MSLFYGFIVVSLEETLYVLCAEVVPAFADNVNLINVS